MKTIDQFRETHKFCISSVDVKKMNQVIEFFESEERNGNVCYIANNDPDKFEYTVRVDYDDKLIDYVVKVSIRVRIIEQEEIFKYSEIKAALEHFSR